MKKADKELQRLHDALDGKRIPDAYDQLEVAVRRFKCGLKRFIKYEGWWLKLVAYALLTLLVLVLLAVTFAPEVEGADVYFDVGCRVYHDADQTVPTSTWQVLSFNAERYDTDDIHNVTPDSTKLTCNTAGTYVISGEVTYEQNTTGVRMLVIYVNTTQSVNMDKKNANNEGISVLNVNSVCSLDVGDFVQLKTWQNSGGNLKVVNTGAHSPEFSMQRIGTGGEPVDIELNLGMYAMIFGLALLFVSFFLRSLFIYMAIALCMVGVLVEPTFNGSWLQAGAVIILVLCGVAMINLGRERGY